MSVFGGDSWGREAQYRKRRVDDLLLQGVDGSSFKKLSSGKYACLVCSHNPILDSPIMLSMHCKGSRHLAAESRLKQKEVINKRLSLSHAPAGTVDSSCSNKKVRLANKPLIQQTGKAVSEVLCGQTSEQKSTDQNCGVKLSEKQVTNVATTACPFVQAYDRSHIQEQLDFREHRERELKFIEAGWKRDSHGRWYQDENVEFDSDEEDPNVCLG